jgi:hypothetical protein
MGYLKDCDEILYLNHGEVKLRGRFEDIMDNLSALSKELESKCEDKKSYLSSRRSSIQSFMSLNYIDDYNQHYGNISINSKSSIKMQKVENVRYFNKLQGNKNISVLRKLKLYQIIFIRLKTLI